MSKYDMTDISEMDAEKLEQLVKDKVLVKIYDPVADTMNYFVSNDKTSSASRMTNFHVKAGINMSRQLTRKSALRERLREKLEAKQKN